MTRKEIQEIIAEIFPNLLKTINPQIQKTQQAQSRVNIHKIILIIAHIILKKKLKSSQGRIYYVHRNKYKNDCSVLVETENTMQL